MLIINYRDSRPIYEQIRDGLRNLILSNVLKPDEKLPSVRDLASVHAINPNTIQRAYRELEQEGYIYSISGKGSFVAHELEKDHKRISELTEKFRSAAHELKILGVDQEELKEIITLVYKD